MCVLKYTLYRVNLCIKRKVLVKKMLRAVFYCDKANLVSVARL